MVCWCGVVVCKDNNKGGECNIVVVGAGDVYGDDRLVVVVFRLVGLGIEKTSTRALPNKNCPLYDTIFTDIHSLIIHKTAYSILVSETI